MGRQKYRAGQALVDRGAPLKTTPLIFHSEPMMTAINYARALEADGEFGATAKDGWKLANTEMRRYALRDIPTTWDVPIRLGLREERLERASQLNEQLEQLLPGQYKAIEQKLRDQLTEAQKQALDTSPMDRTDDQHKAAYAATEATKVSWTMVAREAPLDVRDKARELARQYVETTETAEIIERYREIVNFNYWRACCEAEVTEPALRAREAAWRADREFKAARLQPAKKAFEESFAAWREVLDGSEILREDTFMAEDLNELIDKYRKVLDQLDEKFPTPFVLQDMFDRR